MRTLFIRNVPDEAAERLEALASREGISLNALAVRELSSAARRTKNEPRLATLPVVDRVSEDVVRGLREDRDRR